MARKFHVEGPRNYLIAAIILFLLSLWFIRDGWFPTAGILEKHPDPQDSFYLFNKSMSVILLIASAVCGYIHSVVK
jgi:hypothetical protein